MRIEDVLALIDDHDRTARRFGFDEAASFEREKVARALRQLVASTAAPQSAIVASLRALLAEYVATLEQVKGYHWDGIYMSESDMADDYVGGFLAWLEERQAAPNPPAAP